LDRTAHPCSGAAHRRSVGATTAKAAGGWRARRNAELAGQWPETYGISAGQQHRWLPRQRARPALLPAWSIAAVMSTPTAATPTIAKHSRLVARPARCTPRSSTGTDVRSFFNPADGFPRHTLVVARRRRSVPGSPIEARVPDGLVGGRSGSWRCVVQIAHWTPPPSDLHLLFGGMTHSWRHLGVRPRRPLSAAVLRLGSPASEA
jgi:hypothetical protein